jgi:squalene-hopene/tetraprenyl-beta-curcumene cyclase
MFSSATIQQKSDTVKAVLDQMTEKWRGSVSLEGNFNDPKTTIYDCYPFLFLKAFPLIDTESVDLLAIAGRLYATSIIIYDRIMERNNTAYLATNQAFSLQAMQWEANRLLHRLFPPDSIFWNRFQEYLVQHTEACILEQNFASGKRVWSEYTEEIALRIAVGKNGISRTAIAGLVEIVKDESFFKPLVESINQFNIACQMWDDLCDWKQDLQSATPSLLLSRFIKERPSFSSASDGAEKMKELARELYYDGHARFILELALESLDKANESAASVPELEWHHIIADLRNRCQALLKDVEQIVSNNISRVEKQPSFDLNLPPALNLWQQVAWDALGFVIEQWRLGFGEARHIMHLAREEGFGAEMEYHYGDLFQRALIADAFCDVDMVLKGSLEPVLRYETDYLLSCRQNSGVGGWKYFYNVPEIALDADDLGQIMQVLLRTERRTEAVSFCEGPLEVLLRDNIRTDGSIETWIIPAKGRSPEQERQAEFNQMKWGTGPDIDVMANFLYGLALYDSDRFSETILRGALYLETLQCEDGSWESRWYYGPFYGTYVCLRLLDLVRPDSSSIESAQRFLLNCRHSDNGWGMNIESDPLSTALALLGLAYTDKYGDCIGKSEIEQSLEYLNREKESDGGWRNIPFIRPRMSDSYGSRTITSMYVLKAATAWRGLFE